MSINENSIWLEHPDYPMYRFSPEGDVLSLYNNMIKKKTLNVYKYEVVNIQGHGTKIVHRLIADVFCPNPDNKPQVNHLDGNRSNNIYTNLEWCTPMENTRHAMNTGLFKFGEDSHDAKLSNSDVTEIVKRLHDGESCMAISKDYNVGDGAINDIMAGRRWSKITGIKKGDFIAYVCRGEDSPNTNLTESNVSEIRILIYMGGSSRVIAREYNTSKTAILNIKNGKTWSHVWAFFQTYQTELTGR